MERRVIDPNVLSNLSRGSWQDIQQRTYEQPPKHEPKLEKKSFWNKVKGFFKEAKEVIVEYVAPTVVAVTSALAGIFALAKKRKSKKQSRKKHRKNLGKKARNTQPIYINNFGTMVWA